MVCPDSARRVQAGRQLLAAYLPLILLRGPGGESRPCSQELLAPSSSSPAQQPLPLGFSLRCRCPSVTGWGGWVGGGPGPCVFILLGLSKQVVSLSEKCSEVGCVFWEEMWGMVDVSEREGEGSSTPLSTYTFHLPPPTRFRVGFPFFPSCLPPLPSNQSQTTSWSRYSLMSVAQTSVLFPGVRGWD